MVIFGYVMPDVANHKAPLIHPIGSELDTKTGQVIEHMEQGWHKKEAGAEGSGEH